MSKPPLNADQSEAFTSLKRFIDHPALNTFVLKGYAGTGKTFLMQYLARHLEKKNIEFCMLASTGRAASVLRGKTGCGARTVHSELYHFGGVNGAEEDMSPENPVIVNGQLKLQFDLREVDQRKRVYIVDEASMLSSEPSNDSAVTTFGTGQLLLDFFQATGNNKVIFVGDPSQLPPVGQAFSPALDMDWLRAHNRHAIDVTLTKIERNDPNNDILKLASHIRNMPLELNLPKYPKLPARNMHNVKLHDDFDKIFKSYLQKHREVGIRGSLAIARSNKTVRDINGEIRKNLFSESEKGIQVRDVLQVVKNNQMVPLTNGDFVVVTKVGEIKTRANLHFQYVKVKQADFETEFELLLCLEGLHCDSGRLSKEQEQALIIDFNQRMQKEQIKVNSDEYKLRMRMDRYYNCLRATYGYAVTCHKSQGGEWDDVFLFLESSMYAMEKPELFRWWYTAVTRARKNLNLTNDWWIA